MPEYAAPEMVLGWARNAAADCWSFGVLVSFMLLGTVRTLIWQCGVSELNENF